MNFSSMSVSSLLFLILIAADVYAGKWFFSQGIPKARSALETRLNASIETSLMGVWNLSDESSNETIRPWWHGILVTSCHLILMLGFLAFLLSQILIIFLVARWATESH